MKKSIFTVALALVASVTFANNSYENLSENPSTSTIIKVEKEELSSFCRAIIQGNKEMVKQLIGLGENVNKKSLGKTPAMYAARYNKAEILALLVENGADLSAKSSKEKYTAKKFAELSNATAVLKVIETAEMK